MMYRRENFSGAAQQLRHAAALHATRNRIDNSTRFLFPVQILRGGPRDFSSTLLSLLEGPADALLPENGPGVPAPMFTADELQSLLSPDTAVADALQPENNSNCSAADLSVTGRLFWVMTQHRLGESESARQQLTDVIRVIENRLNQEKWPPTIPIDILDERTYPPTSQEKIQWRILRSEAEQLIGTSLPKSQSSN